MPLPNGGTGHERRAGQPGHDCCGARHHRGSGICKLPASWGTDHPGTGRCRKHLGNTANHITAAAEELARRATEKFALPITTTARQALADELARANGMVAWLMARCRELAEAGEIVWGTERRTIRDPAPGQQQGQPVVKRQAEARLRAGPGWQDTGLIVTDGHGAMVPPWLVSEMFGRLARKAGLEVIRLHDARHTADTIWREAGVDLKVIQEWLGHINTAPSPSRWTVTSTSGPRLTRPRRPTWAASRRPV